MKMTHHRAGYGANVATTVFVGTSGASKKWITTWFRNSFTFNRGSGKTCVVPDTVDFHATDTRVFADTLHYCPSTLRTGP